MKWDRLVKYQAIIGVLFFIGMITWAIFYLTT